MLDSLISRICIVIKWLVHNIDHIDLYKDITMPNEPLSVFPGINLVRTRGVNGITEEVK